MTEMRVNLRIKDNADTSYFHQALEYYLDSDNFTEERTKYSSAFVCIIGSTAFIFHKNSSKSVSVIAELARINSYD